MSNLKIDIIYYKTSSDFEMEFNLSGCCRMRIFKDKIESEKSLINTLARDVARSKIIIVVTDLLGENSGVPVISKAIGLSMVSPDKSEYGIKTNDEILIPSTAVPLVTKSGIFGGCIIESGPQSIIIVSSSRALRHEIMKTYIHNYVFDVAQLLAYQQRVNGQHSTLPPITSVIDTQNTPSDDSTETGAAEQLGASNVENEPCDNLDETSTVDSPQNDNQSSNESLSSVVPGIDSTAEIDFNEESEDYIEIKPQGANKKKKAQKTINIIILIIVILLLLGFGILAYFFVYLPLLGGGNIFTGTDGNIISEFFSSLFA